jgi:hypothetical protein
VQGSEHPHASPGKQHVSLKAFGQKHHVEDGVHDFLASPGLSRVDDPTPLAAAASLQSPGGGRWPSAEAVLSQVAAR